MSRYHYKKTLTKNTPPLNIPGSASVSVFISGTETTAQIYDDAFTPALKSNPFIIVDGIIDFWVAPGEYDIVADAEGEIYRDDDHLAVDPDTIKGPTGDLSFADVANLKTGNALNSSDINWADFLGRTVRTVVNNTTSKVGSAEYVITDVNPGNLSTLVGGIWVGANHDLGGGYYAKLVSVIPFVEEFGVISNGVVDDTDALNSSSSYMKITQSAIQLDPSRTYIIDGGSNTPYSERGVTMTDGWVLPSGSVVFLNGATIRSSSGGATSANQTRLITNETKSHDPLVDRSENIKIVGPVVMEFTGTEGYYCNAIWINGGPLIESYAFDEYFARNITIQGTIETSRMRGSLVVRDENVFEDPGIANSEDKRMAGQITYDTIYSRNGSSFTCSLDGDYIDGNIAKAVNDALTGYDCYSVIRGHHINVNMVHAKNCREYGCIIRSINNSNTVDINIGLLTIEDGQGLIIADDSNQTLTEITEEIHIGVAHLKNTSAVIESRSIGGNTSIRDVQIGQLHVSKGKSGGVLQSIGLRCEKVSTIQVDALYVDNTDGECVVIRDSDNIALDIKRAKRANQVDDILQLIRSSDCSIDLRRSTNGNNCIYLEGDGTTGLERNEIRVGSATGYSNFIETDQNGVAISSSTKIFVNNASNLSLIRTNAPASLSVQFPTERDYVGNMPGFGQVKTISSGAITVDHEKHRVDTEGGAASDDLETMNGGYRGQVVIIGEESSARDVTIKHGVGNILTEDGADIVIADRSEFWTFMFDGDNWVQVK